MMSLRRLSLFCAALWVLLVIGLYLMQFRDMFEAIVQAMRMSAS